MTTVYRQPNNRQGDTIVSSTLTTEDSRIERGRQTINRQQPDKVFQTLRCFDTSFFPPKRGTILHSRGGRYNGVVNSFSLQITGTSVSASVIVEVQK